MSRVGKAPIVIPQGAEISINDDAITVKGPKGTLTQKRHSLVGVRVENGQILFSVVGESREADAMSGTMRALVANMVNGVTRGFEKKLTLVGVGYKAAVQGDTLNLSLGFSHPVLFKLPAGVKAETPQPTEILIKGADKQVVGEIAAKVRAKRPPEPYKGKGVRYADERVVLKETKKK
ncbi:MAG TPA: 50S ribosomal protein L6 [Burkholderiaceae bacterium]|nr:50S ribosomal protein L6 [Burkholderiaceae bacterium]